MPEDALPGRSLPQPRQLLQPPPVGEALRLELRDLLRRTGGEAALRAGVAGEVHGFEGLRIAEPIVAERRVAAQVEALAQAVAAAGVQENSGKARESTARRAWVAAVSSAMP